MQFNTIDPPYLGMFSPEGNVALGNALLEILSLPAHEFPSGRDNAWRFYEWVAAHPVHSVTLAPHDEMRDTDVRDSISWILEDAPRGMKLMQRWAQN